MKSQTTFSRLRLANYLVAACGAIGGIGFEQYASQFSFNAFVLWVASPFLLVPVAIALAQTVQAQIVVLAVSGVMAAGGLYCYWDSMFVHIDAQGALVFVFVPLYQLAAVLAIVGTLLIVRVRVARAARRNG